MPFPAADASVVRSSLRANALLRNEVIAPQYAAYVAVASDSWYSLAAVSVFGAVFGGLSSFQSGRELLLAYPAFFSGGVFSHEGPSEEQLATTSFRTTFFASGFSGKESVSTSDRRTPDVHIVTEVSGPEPGYVATPAISVTLALCLLEEIGSMPRGVLTPAAAFHASGTIFDRLREAGISFKVLKTEEGEGKEQLQQRM